MIDLSTVPRRKAFAATYAAEYLIDSFLLCAVVEHESSWNPYATRMEKAFYDKYILQMTLNDTEEYTRAMSWGLMQVMGETAREFGFKGKFMTELTDPDTGMIFGCKKLKRCLSIHQGDNNAALLAYNGGSDPMYPHIVLNLRSNYY